MSVRLTVAALLALWASPAAADVTARYVAGANAALAMTVEVNDRGDSRTSMGNQGAVLTVNGETYLLMADLAGTFAVRQEDVFALFAAQARAMTSDIAAGPAAAAPPDRSVAVRQGSEVVGGRTGTIWAVRSPGEESAARPGGRARPGEGGGIDFVVSSDPDLAPVGRVLARQLGASVDGMNRMIGPGWGRFGAAMRSIFERGTVIRFGRLLRLESVATGPVPADRFALPETVFSREQYAARMGLSEPR